MPNITTNHAITYTNLLHSKFCKKVMTFFLFQKAYFFYKVVSCTQIKAVEQELHNLVPGKRAKRASYKLISE